MNYIIYYVNYSRPFYFIKLILPCEIIDTLIFLGEFYNQEVNCTIYSIFNNVNSWSKFNSFTGLTLNVEKDQKTIIAYNLFLWVKRK